MDGWIILTDITNQPINWTGPSYVWSPKELNSYPKASLYIMYGLSSHFSQMFGLIVVTAHVTNIYFMI